MTTTKLVLLVVDYSIMYDLCAGPERFPQHVVFSANTQIIRPATKQSKQSTDGKAVIKNET